MIQIGGNDLGELHLSNVNIEATAQRCSVEKVFLKISQNSQENACA